MSASIVGEKNQTTLPADVLAQAGIRPKDSVDWSFENGKIVGRKLITERNAPTVKLVKGPNGLYRLPAGTKFKREDIIAAIRSF